jgi:hypothetical protein
MVVRLSSAAADDPADVIRLDPQRLLAEERHPPRGGRADLRIDGAANRAPTER